MILFVFSWILFDFLVSSSFGRIFCVCGFCCQSFLGNAVVISNSPLPLIQFLFIHGEWRGKGVHFLSLSSANWSWRTLQLWSSKRKCSLGVPWLSCRTVIFVLCEHGNILWLHWKRKISGSGCIIKNTVSSTSYFIICSLSVSSVNQMLSFLSVLCLKLVSGSCVFLQAERGSSRQCNGDCTDGFHHKLALSSSFSSYIATSIFEA